MTYRGNFGGTRFSPQDISTLSATTKSRYISDAVLDAAGFLYGREAMVRLLPVVYDRPFSLCRYDRTIGEILERVASNLGPKRKQNVGTSTGAAIHRIQHVLLPIFDSEIHHWCIAHIQPLESTIHILDSLRPSDYEDRERFYRLGAGASHLNPPPSPLWSGRTPPLLCIIQTIEAMRAFEACSGNTDEALDLLRDPGHVWPQWMVVETKHASPQIGADCGIMTLLYIRAVCKGTITDPEASTVRGGALAHAERETIHDHLLSWNHRGLERIDFKYIHHTPMVILEDILIHHVITDEERCGDPITIECIVQCSDDIEDTIVQCLYHILRLANIPSSVLKVHRARSLSPTDDAWHRATLFIHLFSNGDREGYERGLHATIRRLVGEAHRIDPATGGTQVFPLTIIAGFLCKGLDRPNLFPHSCYKAPNGAIVPPEGRETCENWYLVATSSFNDTPWASRRGCQCEAFVGLPQDLYLPRASEHPRVLIVERQYMSLGLAEDKF